MTTAEAAVKATGGRGRFISFEGGEGSGKSTQIKILAERLAGAKLHAIVTREPGGSPGAEIIRHLVLSGMGKLLGPEAETLLFAAARDDHARTVIEPALKQGTWVLSDRFLDSTRVYQGALGQVAPGILNAMQRVTIGDLKPDLTVILDVPVEIGLKRAAARRGTAAADRFEFGRHRFSPATARRLSADRRERAGALRADRRHRGSGEGRGQHLVRLARSVFCDKLWKRGCFRMSSKTETQISVPHPRETTDLFGHREAETALLNAYR